MSGRDYTPQELANKVDWEGGWYDGIIGYGIDADDLDPDRCSPDQIEAVREFIKVGIRLREIENRLYRLFPDPGSEDEDEDY